MTVQYLLHGVWQFLPVGGEKPEETMGKPDPEEIVSIPEKLVNYITTSNQISLDR